MVRQKTSSEQSVKFDNVSKIYRLGRGHTSLRDAIMSLSHRLLGKGQDDYGRTNLAALDQASFEITQGESVGLIGPNGSGKTTTLRLISNITRATYGTVWVNGRVSALIELGAGFHPDLTGRENIYFNAAILGMRRHEIQARFDEIVDFSGLSRFLDTPVKRYSSGMYCRLGFAVAAHVNPDILLVDEVLAVGDAVFQAKCLKRLGELRANATTIVFVTHNLGYLQRLCNRAIFLYQGKVMVDGPVAEAIQVYRNHTAYSREKQETDSELACEPSLTSAEAVPDLSSESSSVSITNVRFSDGRGEWLDKVQTGTSLMIHVEYKALRPIANANCEVWLYGLDGTEYTSFATAWDGIGSLTLTGSGEVCLHIDPVCLMPGAYFINVAISDQDGLAKYDMHWERHRVSVLSGPVSYGLLYQPHQWTVDDAQIG